MFIKVVDVNKTPEKASWDNYTVFHDGYYYAMFNVTYRNMSSYAFDIYKSSDGVHWEVLCEEQLWINGAHAGFSLHKFGDYFMYHPTCTDAQKGIHFKAYYSKDLLEWEHLGDANDVVPDKRYYEQRWDEIIILDDVDDCGRIIYYGYISSEVRKSIGTPSCAMLKSYDGIHWDILPPPVINWGRIPPHHMEVNFCEKIKGRYYLNMSARLYMDSLGYSLYTFVADKPEGPFKPDETMFRLCGASLHDITWLSHTINSPDGLLCATWLNKDQMPDIPSQSFTIAPFKRLLCNEEGHLRLGYWSENDAAKGCQSRLKNVSMVHPIPSVKSDRDEFDVEDDKITIHAGRDGVILIFDKSFDIKKGFVIEGTIVLNESRTQIETHHHAAHFGIYFESGTNCGTAMVVDTQGITRTGLIKYADYKICDYNFRRDIYAGQGLLLGRSGELKGTLSFDCQDTSGPYGHANSSDLRHGSSHSFRLMARSDFFELYIDDYYVQTFFTPDTFTGRVGIIACDGTAVCQKITAWDMNISDE